MLSEPLYLSAFADKKRGGRIPLILPLCKNSYGTVNGRRPSTGKSPVGPATVEGWARNR